MEEQRMEIQNETTMTVRTDSPNIQRNLEDSTKAVRGEESGMDYL